MDTKFTKESTLSAKGLAITFMLIYHLFENEILVTGLGVDYRPFKLDSFLTFSGFGNICVAVFVFLTSYGISIGLMNMEEFSLKPAYDQATKRFLKLMRDFFIVYLSVNVLWGYYFDYSSLYGQGKQSLIYMLTDSLGLSMFFETPTLNMTWWYMEIAYILIFLIPILFWVTKKIGNNILIVSFLLPFVFSMGDDIRRYFFVAVFGVCAACGNWLEKLLNIKIPYPVKLIVSLLLLVLSILIRQNYIIHETYVYLVDAPIAILIIYLATAILGVIPVVGQILRFIGKHSMTIYLVHTFFYMAVWQKYVYSVKYWLAVLLVCLLGTLLYSVILDYIKKAAKKVIQLATRAKK